MMNDLSISHLQRIGDVLSNKYKSSFQGTFRSSDPVYRIKNPIMLPSDRSFEAALIYFATDNYLVNIDSHNQNFYYSVDKGITWKNIKVPGGPYELNQLNNEIKRQMKANGDDDSQIYIDANLTTFNSVIDIKNPNYQIDFTQSNTLKGILGFNSVILKGETTSRHESPKTIQITSTKAINVHCDLVFGGYDSQGVESDIIYSFPAYKVGVGYKINEEPNTPRYLPVAKKVIREIRFRLTNNKREELDFKNEECAFCIYLQQV